MVNVFPLSINAFLVVLASRSLTFELIVGLARFLLQFVRVLVVALAIYLSHLILAFCCTRSQRMGTNRIEALALDSIRLFHVPVRCVRHVHDNPTSNLQPRLP